MKVIVMYHNRHLDNFKERHLKKFQAEIEKTARIINATSKYQKVFVVVLASVLYAEKVFAIAKDPTQQFDRVENKFLGMLRKLGRLACIVMAIVEIIRSALNGNSKAIGQIIVKYALIYGALFFMPWVFDMIEESFS